MSNLNEKISTIASKSAADRHSKFQLIYFVVGKEPTIQSRMWRCVRELQTRQESLRAMENESQELKDRITLMEIEKNRLSATKCQPDEYAEQERTVKLRQFNRKLEDLQHTLDVIKLKKVYLEEECAVFVEIFEHLEKLEPYKSFDDEKAQHEYWNEKLSQELNMRTLLQHPLDSELIKTILSLNNDFPVKKYTVKLLESWQKEAVQRKTAKLPQ